MGEKLNTAEYDKKGRCVRHPAIRLRKKKIFGGWKIIIGHCPECCLDEMRRVRDEIGAEDDNDDHNRLSSKRRSRKEKKKKRSDRDRDGHRRSSKHNHRHGGRSEDSVSEAGSQPSRGYRASAEGGDRGGPMPEGPSMGHIDEQSPMPGHHHPQAPHIRHDGESTGTGSTAQNSSMDGSSDYRHGGQHVRYPQNGHHGGGGGGRDGGYYQQQQQADNNNNFPPPPPQPQRTMVLSMAFTDPQTGQRGTYTGQVNSINHKPDGKGTVYYANGNIAEGTWSAGMLVDDDENSSHSGSHSQREQQQQYEPRGASRGRPQVNRSRDMGGGGGYGSAPPARGEEMGYVDDNVHHSHHHHPPSNNNRSRSKSRSRDPSGMASPPPPPPRRHRDASRDSLNRQHSSSGSSRRVNPPPPPPTASSGLTGNLDKLDSLGGKKKSRRAPRGASASVQSYNSREGPNIPSGSASVQMEYGGSGRVFGDHMSSPLKSSSASMSGFDSSRGSSGIVYDGGGSVGYNNNEYRRRDSRGHSQPHHSHHGSSGRNPPGYR